MARPARAVRGRPPRASRETPAVRSAVDELVIEALASDEAAALERIRDLEHENEILRDMVREVVSQLHEVTIARDRNRFRVHIVVNELRAVSDEVRTLRAQVRAQQHAA